MERAEYQLIENVQTRHWWWRGRRDIIETVLDENIGRAAELNIVDVGAGFGANIPTLQQYGKVTALELDPSALQRIQEDFGAEVATLRWKSPEPLAQRFDLAVLADVLEHIPDDAAAVEWLSRHLVPGGYVLITVPAHNFFWTEMDDVVHHFRRYDKAGLINLFSERFEIRLASYYNMFLFPVKAAFVGYARGLRALRPEVPKRSFNDVPPQIVNETFYRVLQFESRLIRKHSLPFGVSLILLGRARAR
jgi:SAM-dependent methyltransferase